MNKYLANSCKILFVVAFVTIVAATVVIAYPKYRHARDLMMEKERIMRRIDEKRAEIAEIKTKQNRSRARTAACSPASWCLCLTTSPSPQCLCRSPWRTC